MSNRDITYCMDRCDHKECFRNKCHTSFGFYSCSNLRQTDLCPRNRSYYRSIPAAYWDLITREFCVNFLEELRKVFCEAMPKPENIYLIVGTIGWQKAFEMTCFTHDVPKLIEYANCAEWDEYDRFASELTELCFYWEDVYGA